MSELSIYYCSKCGRYGYYQISRNAVCPDCTEPMTILPMNYQEFMELNSSARDQIIAEHLSGRLLPHSCVLQRLFDSAESDCVRTESARLCSAIETLEQENQTLRLKNNELEHTVAWMHELIWDLTRRLHSQS